MAKAVHSMIRVLDEDRSTAFYASVFGLEVVDRYPFDGFTLTYLGNAENDFELELTINHDRATPYEHADGYGHLAVVVDDLEADHARLTGLGHDQVAGSTISELGVVDAEHLEYVRKTFQAAVQARRGAADTAITVARDALALCGDTDDHATAVLLGLTGAILVELGQHAEGIEHLERSLVIRRSRGDKVGQALTLHNLGETYGRIRRYPEATGSLLAALELRKDLDDRFGQANTHKELGIQLASQGSFSAAREHSREALRIFEELGAPEAAAVRAWLGRVG